jgi:hypothetical protein
MFIPEEEDAASGTDLRRGQWRVRETTKTKSRVRVRVPGAYLRYHRSSVPERTREPRGDRHQLEIRINSDRRRRTVHELT